MGLVMEMVVVVEFKAVEIVLEDCPLDCWSTFICQFSKTDGNVP